MIRWILFLQDIDLEIWDKKEKENVVANHLSRLEIPRGDDEPINKQFPNEQLMLVHQVERP